MGRLSDERAWELLREPIISFITTLRADGTPHVTPVWHMAEGGEIVIAVARDTVKARNVRRNPAVALCAAADERPQPWVLVSGEARLSDEGAADFVRAVSAHYLGAEEAKPYAEDALAQRDFTLLRISPARVAGYDGLD